MTKTLSVLLSFLIVFGSVNVAAQDTAPEPEVAAEDSGSFRLSVPLLEGMTAPFDGLLIGEDDVFQCVEDAAAVGRLTIELAARTRELELSSSLRDQFIAEQRTRIEELSRRSWWDENGNIFMLGLGLILGVAASALVVGLATN